MKNMLKDKKFILITSIISSIVIVGLTGTLAWYVWTTKDDDITKIATNVGVATVVYDDGADITGVELLPVADKNNGIVKEISIRTNYKDNVNELLFNLYLDVKSIAEELKHESFKYELWREGEEEAAISGNFSQESLDASLTECNKNSTNHIVLLEEEPITKDGAIYTLYIWIDGNYELPYEMADKDFSFVLHADGQNAMIVESITPDTSNMTSGTLAYNIVNKYNSTTNKVSVNNGSIKYYYDTENNLMADIDGNVRYYGDNPNNYVYFNCDDYSNPTSSTCEKWRIIGVFDGKVKIVRDTIGTLTWDVSEDESYSNNWHTSSINSLLNNGYYNNVDTTYNNFSTSSGVTSSDINFNTDNIGIKNDETRNLISESTWYLGGSSTATIYADDIYMYERSDKKCSSCTYDTTWTGNVGLIYPSDYAYASDLSVCSNTLRTYAEDSNCLSTNWMYRDDIEYGIWTMTPNSGNATNVWRVFQTGYIDGANASRLKREIHPALYLDEDVAMVAGAGTSDYPYIIWDSYSSWSDLYKGNAVDYVNSVYLSSKSNVVTNNSIEYQYASEIGLMNDRLGGTTSNYDAGNVRYFGAAPSNYVDVGDRDSSGNIIPYRIIGVFKDMTVVNEDGTTEEQDLIKVVRTDSIGAFSWDNKTKGIGSSLSNYGSNDWTDARLMMLLNPGYDEYNEDNPLLDDDGDIIYGYEGSLWWNSKGSDSTSKCYAGDSNAVISCDFTSTGLSSDVHNKIENVVWNLGGTSSGGEKYSNLIYINERGTTVYKGRLTTWIGKVALMYASDFGYATDFNKYNVNLRLLFSDSAIEKSWIYGNKSYGGDWTLTPSYQSNTSIVNVSDYIGSSAVDSYRLYTLLARPTFYLTSNLNITSGVGTSTDPYVIE